jgi:hypothetical protein
LAASSRVLIPMAPIGLCAPPHRLPRLLRPDCTRRLTRLAVVYFHGDRAKARWRRMSRMTICTVRQGPAANLLGLAALPCNTRA